MRAVAALGALSLGACAAEGGMAGDAARFAEAMARAGCVVASDAQAAIVEDHTGFDEDKLRAISNDMLESGALVAVPGGIRLTTGTCANA